MKVRELISELEKQEPDTEVLYDEDKWAEIRTVKVEYDGIQTPFVVIN